MSVDAYVSILNSSSFFYTGQVAALKVALTNFESNSHNVSALSVSGLTVLSISPSLPVAVGSSELDVTVYVQAPSTAINGAVNVTVTTSS